MSVHVYTPPQALLLVPYIPLTDLLVIVLLPTIPRSCKIKATLVTQPVSCVTYSCVSGWKVVFLPDTNTSLCVVLPVMQQRISQEPVFLGNALCLNVVGPRM